MELMLLLDGQKDAEVESERNSLVEFDESDGMWMDSEAREFMKQAVLHHDTVFRQQVLELHRLYWTQKNLMKKDPHNEIASYLKQGGTVEKATNSKIFLMPHLHVNSTLGKAIEECQHQYGHFKFHQTQKIGFELQFPADEYTKIAGDRCFVNNSFIHNNFFGSPASMELKLGSREDANNCTRRSSHMQSSIYIRGLKDSVDVVSNEEVTDGTSFVFQASKTDVIQECQLLAPSGVTSCDIISKNFVGTQAILPQGGQNKHGAQPDSICGSKKQSSSCKVSLFDLNTVQLEEESAALHAHRAMSEGSSAAYLGAADDSPASDIQRESSGSCSKESFLMPQNDTGKFQSKEKSFTDTGFKAVAFCNKRDSECSSQIGGEIWNHDWNNLTIPLEFHRVSSECLSTGFPVTQQYLDLSSSRSPSTLCNNGMYTFDLNVDASLESSNFSCAVSDAVDAKEKVDERNEEDNLSSDQYENHQLTQAKKSAVENCQQFLQEDQSIGINVSNLHSSGVQGQLLLHPCFVKNAAEIQFDSVAVDNCPVLHVPVSGDPNHVCLEMKVCNSDQSVAQANVVQKQSQTEELDFMVLMASEALCSFSLENPASFLYDHADEQQAKEKNEQPQCSSDSFELIVLSLPEVQVDEYISSARPMEEDKKNDPCRFKTRSGRRLRDFQKDILPGLVSLSRHEICEDMHAFTEIMRADSPKKKGTCRTFGGSTGSTLRSRRSKNCLNVRR